MKKNRKNSRNALKIGECPEFIKYAEEMLKDGWSPDATA
jgi:hypothetical protein